MYVCACACVTRLPQTANLIWRRRVSVCHLFPVHRQERTANIDTDKSIVSDIPVPRCRDGDGGDTADFSGANNRAPMPSYRRSSMTLPWSSPPLPLPVSLRGRSPMLFQLGVYCSAITPASDPRHSYRGLAVRYPSRN